MPEPPVAATVSYIPAKAGTTYLFREKGWRKLRSRTSYLISSEIGIRSHFPVGPNIPPADQFRAATR